MTTLLLPMPPSSNNLFPTGKGGKRFISPEYKAWRDEAGYALTAQHPPRHLGPVVVRYEFARFSDKRRRDIANLEKAPSDLLVHHGVIRDDCLIQHLTLEWSAQVQQGKVRVTISDWQNP